MLICRQRQRGSQSNYYFYKLRGARGGAVSSSTALQAGRSRDRFPIVQLDFCIDNASGRTSLRP